MDTNMLYLDTETVSSLSLQTKSMIRQLKKFAAEKQFLGLSSTQGGFIERFFVMSREANGEVDKSNWRTQQVIPYDSYKFFINPKILEICQNVTNKEIAFFRSCSSRIVEIVKCRENKLKKTNFHHHFRCWKLTYLDSVR